MPTIRRPGSAPSDPRAPAPAPPEPGAPAEHSLLPLQVPEDTTPTWELEMLVSGAVLVGLFQLPPVLDAALRSLLPRLATQLAGFLAAVGYTYVKGMVYALMAAFVVHLASRAYWVALVGLDSVFPQGIRWDNALRYGPITKELIQGRVPTLPRTISALDNFCSVVFAVGFVAVSLALMSLAIFATAGALTWALAALFFGGAHTERVLFAVVWLLILPMLVMQLDRRLAARLRPGGPGAAAMRAILRFSPQVAAIRLYGPMLLTLLTNVRRRVVLPLVFALLFGSMGFAFADMLAIRGSAVAGVGPGLPAPLRARAADYRHYADQRLGDQAFASVPFIQSDVIKDPYARLFIPYNVRDDAAELRQCMRGGSPAVPGPAGSGIASSAAGSLRTTAAMAPPERAVRCLASIHAVAINGAARAGLDYRFYTDAVSGLQGLLVYIPVEGLPHGRNLLTVRRPPQPDDDGHLGAATSDSIPFWL